MKLFKLLGIVLILFFGACAKPSDGQAPASSAPAAMPGISPGASNNDPVGEDGTPHEDGQPADTQSTQGKNNRLYDPSIYVIEASDEWRQEVAEGYWADYECKLYLEKVDANDNRSSEGSYSGFFWLGMKLDAGGYISEMLGDVPVEMDFNAGGEGICDNLVITLQPRDIWERESYAIPFANGTTLPPKQDVPVDKGSFIAVAKQAYLDAKATGKQGETLEHHDNKAADVELSYIIHMQPDSMEKGTERSVTIYLSDGKGMSVILFGVMRRLPGYPDDVAKYTQEAPCQKALDKYLQ